MNLRKNAVAAVMVSALALTGVAACGSDDGSGGGGGGGEAGGLEDKSIKEIEKQSMKAMKAADSMSMDAEFASDGQKMAMELSLSKAGDCTGTIAMQGASAEVLRVDGKSYMKPDQKFWELNAGPEQGAAAARVVGDRWVETSAEDDFGEFCDLNKFLDEMDGDDDGGKSNKAGTTTVAGQDALIIEEKDGEETNTGYIATEGEAYILKVDTKGGDQPGTVTFSDFNKPVDVEAPGPGEVVDPAELGG